MSASGGPFSNARYNLRQLGNSPAAWSCVLVILGVECVVMAAGGENRDPARFWFTTLGLSRDGVFGGKIWQFFSYGILHGGWWHLGINAAFLLLIGSRVEHMVGRPALAKTLGLGILGGGIAHLLLAPGGIGAPVLVGISGGCMSLLLLLVTLSPESRMMPIPISGRSLGLGVLSAELILALMNPVFGDSLHMGHACHFGGGIAGWLFGRWLLRPRVSLKSLRHDRARREAEIVRDTR